MAGLLIHPQCILLWIKINSPTSETW